MPRTIQKTVRGINVSSETTITELPPYFKEFEIGDYMLAKVVRVLPKTVVMNLSNKHHGDLLGQVRWFLNWRQYCFKIGDEWFSESCLRDIANFLQRTNDMHKALKKESSK